MQLSKDYKSFIRTISRRKDILELTTEYIILNIIVPYRSVTKFADDVNPQIFDVTREIPAKCKIYFNDEITFESVFGAIILNEKIRFEFEETLIKDNFLTYSIVRPFVEEGFEFLRIITGGGNPNYFLINEFIDWGLGNILNYEDYQCSVYGGNTASYGFQKCFDENESNYCFYTRTPVGGESGFTVELENPIVLGGQKEVKTLSSSYIPEYLEVYGSTDNLDFQLIKREVIENRTNVLFTIDFDTLSEEIV